MSDNRHFDCLKNKLPDNWTNSNATGYYNRAFWKRCKCEYGTKNPCKETADKWNPVASEPDKWSKGCNPCSGYYNRPPAYFYSYNPRDCGNCGNCDDCHKHHDHHGGHHGDRHNDHHDDHHSDHHSDHRDIHHDDDHDDHREHGQHKHKHHYDDCCDCEDKKWNIFSNICNKCHKRYRKEDCKKNCESKASCHPLKSYVYKNGCNDCQDVAIVYRMINNGMDCDNIVELKIPVGGSKEEYLAKHFSPEFIEANKYQCATVPAYNAMQNNVIDNRREEEFTPSDQAALVKRGINNALFAKQLIEEGRLIHEKHEFSIPMNVSGRTSYYYFGDNFTSGSTQTGLAPQDAVKAYFI